MVRMKKQNEYFAVSIFLSAFLLFQIEPMIGRLILPWFGGTSAVWSTALMFFQVLLTGGYAYAYWLTGRGQNRKRVMIHIALLAASLIAVLIWGFIWKSPLTFSLGWQSPSTANPIWEICKLLGVSIGPPFFLLATNSTLMQAWFHRAYPHRTPYALYALSNAGSILGLVSYVLIVEPALTLHAQRIAWSVGYLVFVLLVSYGAYHILQLKSETEEAPSEELVSKPGTGTRVMWIALSACASIMLLATTSQLTQEVAVIPFLWVLPLTLYLLTFILAFSSERWYSRQVFIFIFVGVTILFGRALMLGALLGVPTQVIFLSGGLFTTCWVLHGELYRLRPHPRYLTSFYLLVSVGGAIGGVSVTLIAPIVFKGYWELPLGFALSWILFALVNVINKAEVRRTKLQILNSTLILYGVVFAAMLAYQYIAVDFSDRILMERNFYGVLRVTKTQIGEPGLDVNQMTHGITVHGVQFVSPQFRDQPTTYYTQHSGVGLGILYHPQRGQRMRVGVLGLGIGTLAAYGQTGDVYRFYEINPAVIKLAEGDGGYFSYLKDSLADVEIVPGDARLSLARELAEGSSQNFDLLALDTFDSDSVPVHLIDKQAFEIYLQHLKPNGILAVHISNRHFDFVPVVWKMAQFFDLHMVLIREPGDDFGSLSSDWILLSRDAHVLDNPQISQYATNLDEYTTNIQLWTDDYSNLIQILR